MAEHSRRLTVRPATAEDIAGLDIELPYRIKAVVGEYEGRIAGWGGIAFPPGSDPIVFIDLLEGFDFPVSLHKACLDMMRELGLPRVIATVEPENAIAVRFAERHGFRDTGAIVLGKRVYCWTRGDLCTSANGTSTTTR